MATRVDLGGRGVRAPGYLFQPLATIADQIGKGLRPALEKLPTHPRSSEGWVYGYGLDQTIRLDPTDPVPILEYQPQRSNLSIWDGLLTFGKTVLSAYTSKGASVASDALKSDPALGQFKIAGYAPGGTMGLFDDIWGAVGQAGQSIFGGTQNTIDWNGLLNTGVGLATQALTPRSTAMAPAPMQTSLAGAVPMAARVGAVVGRGFFTRFPNLATAIQTLRNSGMNVTRAKLYGVMKRFGPEFLVTGGLLTAAAVNELAVAGPGYRRMNPANVRALRRSVRRIESFHRLCKTTDRLRGSSRRRKAHC